MIRRMKKYSIKFHISVVAYCLMPNHYHFLLRQDGLFSLSTFMQAVFNSYTKAFNKAYNRTGTLFEGPFKAVHVDRDSYLLHLCRYIHRNPLDAGLVKQLDDWPYSNYLEWVGLRDGTLFDQEFINEQFNSPQEYMHFVREYKPTKEIEKTLRLYMLDG